MKRNRFSSIGVVRTATVLVVGLAAGIFTVGLLSCHSLGGRFAVDATEAVEALTPGLLGRLDPVVIRLKEPVVDPAAVDKALVLSGPGKLSGRWRLLDDRTVEFQPAAPYPAGSELSLAVDTGRLAGGQAGQAGALFRFSVRPASLGLNLEGLEPDDQSPDSYLIRGCLQADIPISVAQAAKSLSAQLEDGSLKTSAAIEWTGNAEAKAQSFIIRAVQRGANDRLLSLRWNGAVIGAVESGQRDFLVPAVASFRLLEISRLDGTADNLGAAAANGQLLARFSENLDLNQDLRGFIDSEGAAELRWLIDGNVIKLFGLEDATNLTIQEGILSADGKILAQQTVTTLTENWEKPEIRFSDKGVILPPTAGTIVRIETKNLSGALIEVYRIHADNVLQFLQVNELDEYYELSRVGDPVWQNSVDFDWDDSMKNRWVSRGLDLSQLTQRYPGGMFQLRLSFRQRHTKYECQVAHADFSSLPMPDDTINLDKRGGIASFWDYFYELDWETRDSYWIYHEDPCHPAFYMTEYNQDMVARQNVLLSDLGIMAKLDSEGSYRITVASIGQATPVSGAVVALYSYTRQLLASGLSDNQGFISLKPVAEAAFIVVSSNNQSSFLKIDHGASLSVSHFAVDGEKPRQGVKGFIYGERGVWRPGDDIHLVFILQDLAKNIAADFPIQFELEDPLGRLKRQAVLTNSVDGFYRIDTGTGVDDPTGAWTARVKAGGQTWSKSLRVEAVIPNRLSIKLETAKPYLVAEDNQFNLSAAWLHGAPAPGLKADVQAAFYPGETQFAGYEGYHFTNPERSIRSETKTVWQGSLGANSQADFKLDLSAGSDLPGMLKALLTTRIYEPSGLFSMEQAVYQYSPYNRYVGVKLPAGDATRGMLLTDLNHQLDIVVVDAEGRLVSGKTDLDVAVYKLEWRWWWEKDALSDATYIDGRYARRWLSDQVTAQNGLAKWDFQINYPEWGRYLVLATDRSGGHSAAQVVYIDWPGWAGRSQEAGTGSAAMLSLTADKNSYQSTERAKVSFASGLGGRALVTVEKDGRVLAQDWLETKAGTTVYELALDSSMTPNVYVHITLLQKHLQTANDLPVRLYGLLPLLVEDPATRLQPTIVSSASFEPGKLASFTVAERQGRPMTYTVAVVDEGLLGLTRFNTADPWNQFYKKEASQLLSWDIYRYVMSAYGGKLETLLAIGGSEELLEVGAKKTERFKPVVHFFGPYRLEAGRSATTEFTMPAYVGAVRLMLVAGRDGAYGKAETTVPVKSPLMAVQTLPRTIGVGEIIDVPVTIFNGLETAQPVTCSFKAEGSASAEASQVLTVPGLSDATINFQLRAKSAGQAVVWVTVRSASAKAEARDEIDIRSRGTQAASVVDFTVEDGAVWKGELASPGESGTRQLTLELSPMPVIDFATRAKFLISYPHGCLEQLTSGAFAQLYLPDLTELSADDIAKVKVHIESVIERYSNYLVKSAGFAYWPGGTETHEWATSYAGHFLLEAQRRGYAVPQSLLEPWIAYQKRRVQTWSPFGSSSQESQAYRLYTLALAGLPEIGGMNRLRSNLSNSGQSTPAAAWLLAAAYALAGHRQTAVEISRGLETVYPAYRDTGLTWGSEVRDMAIALHVLDLIGDQDRAIATTVTVAKAFSDSRWYSTHETAWMLLALTPRYRGAATSTAFTVIANGQRQDGELRRTSAILELAAADANSQRLEVTNRGGRLLYGRVTARSQLAAGQERRLNRGLLLNVSYLDDLGQLSRPENFRLGSNFTVVVSLTNRLNEKLENIILSLPVPTTWEFANERIGFDGEAAVVNYDYRDIKDTSIDSFLSLAPNETKFFAFQATVAYSGDYYLPAIRAEAMYSADYQAVEPGRFITRNR